MQAIGRLRCLVNGCCHGRQTSDAIGIRVTHERSRVIRVAEVSGVPIHPTQLYSILANVFLGLLLLRLWVSGCPTAPDLRNLRHWQRPCPASPKKPTAENRRPPCSPASASINGWR